MRKTFLPLCLVIILYFMVFPFPDGIGRANAQVGDTASGWSRRHRIPGIDELADTPDLVADGAGTVHAFHAQPVSAGDKEWAIVYSAWALERGWTKPIEIILPMSGNLMRVPKAFLAEDGVMHLVFYCCDDATPNIYYSSAPVANAADAQAWTLPELIGPDAENPASVALVGDDQGNLHVLYGGGPLGKGIYAIRSIDEGHSWSDPSPVFLTYDQSLLPFDPKLITDAEGRVHGVWTVNRSDGNGDAIYYAGLADDGIFWADPTLLAAADEETVPAVSSSAIVAHDGELIVVYLKWAPPERLTRASADAGLTWSEPNSFLPPTRGEYGPVTFAVDSNNSLHVIMGDRGRGLTLWHSIRQDGHWQEPAPVVPLGESAAYPVGHPLEFHPVWPRVAISRGNVMIVSWALDFGHGDNGTWYAYRNLRAPELPVTAPPPMPMPPLPMDDAARSSAGPSSVSVEDTTESTRAVSTIDGRVPSSENNPSEWLLNSLLPVAILLMVLVVGKLLYRNRHH